MKEGKLRALLLRREAAPQGPTKGRRLLETHIFKVQGLGPWWVQGEALALPSFLGCRLAALS